jgi:hypothetical protein
MPAVPDEVKLRAWQPLGERLRGRRRAHEVASALHDQDRASGDPADSREQRSRLEEAVVGEVVQLDPRPLQNAVGVRRFNFTCLR